MQNGFVASFNGRIRDEFLNETLFRNLAHARGLITAWVTVYNTVRPRSALRCQPPPASPCIGPPQPPVPPHKMRVLRAGRWLNRSRKA